MIIIINYFSLFSACSRKEISVTAQTRPGLRCVIYSSAVGMKYQQKDVNK
jgi:hypothetical protein